MTKNAGRSRDAAYVGMFAAVMAICSWISVPAPVPFTLQTLGVFTAVGLLGGRRGTLSVAVYIILGAAGLPVFAGFSGGIGSIMGVTGGYIVGFFFSALAMWAIERLCGRSLPALAFAMATGLAICYAFGTLWFMRVYAETSGPIGLAAVLGKCVAPFVIPDLIKIALALGLTSRLKPVIK